MFWIIDKQKDGKRASQRKKDRDRVGDRQTDRQTATWRLVKQITKTTKTTEINNETIWIELKRSLKVAIFHLFGDTFTHRPHTPDSQMHTNEAIFETRKWVKVTRLLQCDRKYVQLKMNTKQWTAMLHSLQKWSRKCHSDGDDTEFVVGHKSVKKTFHQTTGLRKTQQTFELDNTIP